MNRFLLIIAACMGWVLPGKKTCKWVMLLLLMVMAGGSHAQTVTVVKCVLDGSKHQLSKDSAATVRDSAYFSTILQSKLDTPYQVKNIITFSINEYTNIHLPATFSATLNFLIIYTRPDFEVDSVERSLTINYADTSTYTSRNSFVFSNAHQVKVKVLGITIDGAPDIVSALQLENEMHVRVAYKLSCTDDAVKSISAAVTPNTDSTDEVKVTWDAITGADDYDLEWAYIDSSALTDSRYGNPLNPDLIFRNNASRVTVAGNTYSIPLMYDNGGILFFRVRAVQEKERNIRIETAWSSGYSGGLGRYSFTGHQRSLNWQSTINFAEEGKRRVAVQYYDGSLRSRQVVTKDNTTNTTVVGESYYDYQGRPVIQVMPTPTLSSVVKYSRNFNQTVNGAAYEKDNYDYLETPADFLTASAKPMSSATGANQYYSANNPEKNDDINQYIPDAGGYAFTEVSYTQDNSGRISRQSGVGPVYKLGSNHETKYSYSTPSESDLDALFGTEAGEKTHYFKNTVQDANGQYNVSYVDMYGRTVATALSGVPDSASLTALTYNPLITYTDTLSRKNNTIVRDLVIESKQNQLVTVEGNYVFNYLLKAPVLQRTDCNGNTVCYNGLYDLEIKITDDAFNQRLGGKAFDTILRNYIPGTYPTDCSAAGEIWVGFTKRLPRGNYQITKRLVINRDALDYYRDSVFLPRQVCTTLDQFVQQQRELIENAQSCVPECKSCRDSIGTWETFRNSYLNRANVSATDSALFRNEAFTAYQSAVASCDVLCNVTSEETDVRNAMLLDVSAPYGQYANVEDTLSVYSIFYHKDAKTLPPYKRDSVIYFDEMGRKDTVYDESTHQYVLPQQLTPEQFADKFKSSWAAGLLKFHPEYYKLLELQKYKASYDWDRKFEETDTYAEAKANGYLNPTANGSLYFPVVLSNKDPLAAESVIQQNAIEKILKNYNNGTGSNVLSMWSVATITVKCDGNITSCYNAYNTPAAAFNESKLCPGDLDMAWRAFRQLYLLTKQNILNEKINNVVYPGYTKVTSAKLVSDGKQPNFNNAANALDQNGGGFLSNNTNETVLRDSINNALLRSYDENCNSYVQAWVKQLAPCKYSQAALDIIIPRLLTVCKNGADMDHPYGASSVKPSSTNYYRSFTEVLEAFNAQYGISDPLNCNGYLITLPAPYGKQPAYSNKPSYTKPNDCECNQLRILNLEYNAYKKGADVSLATYLNRTRGTSLSETQVQQLLSACNMPTGNDECTYFTSALEIPSLIQCNIAPPCATCTVVDSLYNRFTTLYAGVVPQREEADPLQKSKNDLFVAFMNNQLGFNKQVWEYLAFRDSCQLHPSTDSIVCRSGKPLIHSYTNSDNDVIQDVIRTPDNGFLMAGLTTISPDNTNAYLLRTDANGNVLWAKNYGSFWNDFFYKVKSTSDGGYVAIGTIKGYAVESDVLIVKTNEIGDVMWSRRIGYNTPFGEVGADIIQTADGGYAFAAKYNLGNGVADALIGALTEGGNSKWLRRVGTGSGEEGYSILENKDTLVIAGCSYYSGQGQQFDGWILKMNKHTGQRISVYQYDVGETAKLNNYSAFLHKTPGGYTFGLAIGNGAGVRQSIVKINEAGYVLSAKQLSRPLDSIVGQWMPTGLATDGGMMTVQNSLMTAANRITWHKMKADGTLAWSDMIMLDSSTYLNKILENADGSFTGAGTYGKSAFMMFEPVRDKRQCYDSLINITSKDILAITNLSSIMVYDVVLSDTGLHAISLTAKVSDPVHKVFNCIGSDSCFRMSRGPLLCGSSSPVFDNAVPDDINNCSDNEFFAISKGTELFNAYRDSLKTVFDKAYIDSCTNAGLREVFTVSYTTSEYHYTLYYYDRAGNLVRTVPPAGVVINRSAAWLGSVKAARAAGQERVPVHTLATSYRYNTLNQVIAKYTPDDGQSKFFYDRIGRPVASQDAAQVTSNYLYTVYDELGRITENGNISAGVNMTTTVARTPASLAQWLYNARNSRTEIIQTNYDVPYTPLSGVILDATNLRNRVAWSAIYNTTALLNTGTYAAATFYSYDMHGNVDTLVQDFRSGGMADGGNRFKKIVYRYDLISGKVNHVAYQPGQVDAFYHRYSYDAENRITNVATSRDSIYWDNDAYYKYYKHGVLARTVLGQQQVQGLDYAYTLQGWLKGVNSTALTPGFDMGHDGATGTAVAKDAFGYALHYYGSRDYNPVNGAVKPFAEATGTNFKPLFNGNIGAISQHISTIGTPLQYAYSYDVLNRITGMQALSGLNTSTNSWIPVAIQDFKEAVTYDPNGNIRTYSRNGNNTFAGKPLAMDNLTYSYATGTNKLSSIADAVPATNYDNDIDNQTGSFIYDAVGRIISDVAGGTRITWNRRSKISRITNTSNVLLANFSYDVSGNRISKTAAGIETWYVRDAAGNVMSTYTKGNSNVNNGELTETEVHLYGSSRLGINTLNTNVQNVLYPEVVSLPGLGSGINTNFIRGKKFFELSNHLGNVLATVSDKKLGISTNGTTVDHYEADVVSAQEYYPFGMQMPGRGFSSSKYRYGFNGKENDNEVKGEGNQQDYGFRIYDPRVGRFLSVDPITKDYPELTPYQFASNSPIQGADVDGLELVNNNNDLHFAKIVRGVLSLGVVNAPIIEKGVEYGTKMAVNAGGRLVASEGLAVGGSTFGGALLTIGLTILPLPIGNPEGSQWWNDHRNEPSAFVGKYIDDHNDVYHVLDPEKVLERLPRNGPLRGIFKDYPDGDNDDVILYRGVHAKHPDLPNALLGIAIPWGLNGGHSNPTKHNENENYSIFTSWTLNESIAKGWATERGAGGVLLTKKFKLHQLVPSPDRFDELEILVPGVVTGADSKVLK
jgi:RHS repeat-associated protein